MTPTATLQEDNMDIFNRMLDKHHHHSRKHHSHDSGWHDYDRFQDNRHLSRRNHGRIDHHDYRDGHAMETRIQLLLRQLMGNRKAVGLLLLFAAMLVVLAVGALISLFPMLLKLIVQVGADGLTGVLEQAKPLADALKLGTAK
jgi:hypothetical protein